MAERDDGFGRRKDGKPFADGNTRDDGSYIVGKGRTPSGTRFQQNDGRKRGKRHKGTRNLATDWREELAETIEITENGKKLRVSKQRGVIKRTTSDALGGQARSQDIVMRNADLRDAADERAGQFKLTRSEIIAQWLAEQGYASRPGEITDDNDVIPGPSEIDPADGEDGDADQ